MSVSTLKSINFDKYFRLLHMLIPASAGFAIRDRAGDLIATSCNTGEPGNDDFTNTRVSNQTSLNSPFCNTCFFATHADEDLIKVVIHDRANDVIGTLLAATGNNHHEQDNSDQSAIEETLQVISSCISSDNNHVVELDEMARELAGRYEELNLVYQTNDDITEFQHETEALRQLLSNCVEYLDLGAAALVFPEQDSISCVTGIHDPVEEPFKIIPRFSNDLYLSIKESNESIIINDFSDPDRTRLNLVVPYKVMASPVINNQGTVTGILVCLNHMNKPDFFNSDKNLLHVMSRKVSKILQINYDDLTGLINMHAFQPCLQAAIDSASAKGIFHSLLNIDLDQLRVINDSHGREAGDAAITTLSDILKKQLRNTDTICYLGEGRFGVLLEMCSIEQGMKVANNVREVLINNPFEWKSAPVDINTSIGITLIEPGTKNSDLVLEEAEIALESAKENGISKIRVYRNDDKDLADRKNQLRWVSRIQSALRDNMFRLYCQAIQPLIQTNENYHFEILLRLCDETGQIIPPVEFITPAERFNLMPLLDRWVIDSTFSTLSENGFAQHSGEGMVSINLSGQSLADEGLITYIDKKLDEYQLASECICFEITETAAIGNIKSAHDVIVSLKTKGYKFSLDDFGTGLSSFSYLKDLPVDYLKIDGSFVRLILEDRISHAMVASINNIGHVIGLKTIAEYVENNDIKNQLQLIGVDYAQGYSICMPTPLQQYLDSVGMETSSKAG